ncbi:MAG: hypothetical protein LBQ98_10370 [Nitrososphaerota archaeon]|jgi:hypothetical protein|nr:hypothetical protein [Nitrososphaerota archaeon]
MIGYKLLSGTPTKYANDWWDGSYTRILFPNANLNSQCLNEFYQEIGNKGTQLEFFQAYLQHFYPNQQITAVLIDSIGLPNDTIFSLPAIGTQGRLTPNKSRLLLVIDQNTTQPLFFRYAADNIVDVSTLRATIAELKTYPIHISHMLIDAGYYSQTNLRLLYGADPDDVTAGMQALAFLMCLDQNSKLYKTLLAEHSQDIVQEKYVVLYRDRRVYVKRVLVDLFGHVGYAYIVLDREQWREKISWHVPSVLGVSGVDCVDRVDVESGAVCVFVCSEKLEAEQALSLYYLRQIVEVMFDMGEIFADGLPFEVEGEDIFLGYLFLSFLCATVFLSLNQLLKGSAYDVWGAFAVLRNQKCKVFDDCVLVKEATKEMNELYKKLDIDPAYSTERNQL